MPAAEGGNKICCRCKLTLPVSSFYEKKNTKDKLSPYCIDCDKKQCKSYRENNKEACINRSKEYYKNNKQDVLAKSRVKLGWTELDFILCMYLQDEKCKICGIEVVDSKGTSKRSAVTANADRCHTTNLKRAILCTKCNSMLGMARDNPSILNAGADYLNFYKERNANQ